MNRRPALRHRLAGPQLALLLAALVGLSCGKDGAPLKPSGTAVRPGGASPAPVFPSDGPIVPTDAVITLQQTAGLIEFLDEHEIDLVSSLTVPGAGAFPEQTYHLVRSRDEKPLDLLPLELDQRSQSVIRHHRVWMPEDDRGGLSFDDADSWREGGDYLAQPSIARLNIPAAKAITDGSGEEIAILDTGIDSDHRLFKDIGAMIEPGLNFTVFPPEEGVEETANGEDEDADGDPDDGTGHGTHVAGIVLLGAPQASLVIHKVLDDEGRGTVFGLAMAALYAADKGVDVINLSLGLHVNDPLLRHVLQRCAEKGIAIVASAGNRGTDEVQYPAALPFVFSVTAVNDQDVKANFASFGLTVDVSAPGVDIVSPIPGFFGTGRYAVASGSSMAAPFVTAAVALAHARWPNLAPSQAAGHVAYHAIDITPMNPQIPNLLGKGRVDYLAPLTTSP